MPDGPEALEAEREMRERWPNALYPQRGMQDAAHRSMASTIFLGGAASSGKTWYVLWHPTQFFGVKNYNCTYVRRDTKETKQPGGLWVEGSALWGQFPGVHLKGVPLEADWPRAQGRRRPTWQTAFIHVHNEAPAEVEKKKGLQTCDLIIEEATGFREETVVYLMGRNRPARLCKKPAQCLLTCNPDRDSWVFNWVRPWVDPEHPMWPVPFGDVREMYRWEQLNADPPEMVARHLVHRDGALCWLDGGFNAEVDAYNATIDDPRKRKSRAKTVTYIQGSVYENTALLSTDGGLDNLANLESQDYIQRERLLHSNWLIRDGDSHTFQRDWFQVVNEPPAKIVRTCRSWDYSVRRKYTRSRTKPDYTVGVKVGRLEMSKGGRPCYIILDMWRQRCTPSEAEDATKEVAEADGKAVAILQQITHGDEGIRALNMTRRHVVPNFNVVGVKLKGDKEDRAFHFSAAAQQERVYVLNAQWTADFLTECANFPNGRYDDQVDATSVAITHLRDGASTMAAPAPPKKRVSRW
jgi:predicted phage terminase large subunit-like protein